MHSRNEKCQQWGRISLFIVCLVILFIVSRAAVDLSYETFQLHSIPFAAAVAWFPMYIVLSLLPNLLNGLVGFSGLLTELNGALCVLYVISLTWALPNLPDDRTEIWKLFVPFILAVDVESMYLAVKGYAPIEINGDFKDAPTIGEVWANSCTTYFFEVFKDFTERLAKFEKKQSQTDVTFSITLKKMIILIPLSCDVEGTLDKYSNIQYFDTLEVRRDAQGGNVNRQYKNPIYKVTSTDGSDHMHVAIEEPNTLVALKKLRGSVPDEIWTFQRDEFISAFQDRLSKQKYCCAVLLYDDLQEELTQPLNEFLFEEVRKLLSEGCGKKTK